VNTLMVHAPVSSPLTVAAPLADIGAAAASPATFGFDAGRDLRGRLDCEFSVAFIGADAAGVVAGATCALGLRPKPRAFVAVERCSE
jgi:hypothetical protein